MDHEGGCYCGAVRYKTGGDPMFKGMCYCRECQYISGGAQNIVIGMPEAQFAYTKGKPKTFSRSDLDTPVAREFCGDCGTHLLSKAAGVPGGVLIKVGTLDDPKLFDAAQMAIFTVDKQHYHQLPEGAATFERTPGG
jgi:hypothetical protein